MTPGIVVALANGLWPRLMGLLAKLPESGPEKIREIAIRAPVSVALGAEEAEELLHLAHLASHTAARWLSGEEIIAAAVPYAPIPNVPSIHRFGEPLYTGEALYVVGGRIVKAGQTVHFTGGIETPDVPSAESIISALETFTETIGSDSPGLADFIETGLSEAEQEGVTLESLMEIYPDWFVRRLPGIVGTVQ